MTDFVFPGIISYTLAPNFGAPGAGLSGREIIEGGGSTDPYDGGPYKVLGDVGIDSTPDVMVHRRVRLICTRTGRLVRETWSDPVTGIYRFEHVRIGPWTVLAHDYTGTYNAVVADNMLGELP